MLVAQTIATREVSPMHHLSRIRVALAVVVLVAGAASLLGVAGHVARVAAVAGLVLLGLVLAVDGYVRTRTPRRRSDPAPPPPSVWDI